MKKLTVIIISSLYALNCCAQTVDTATIKAEKYFKEAKDAAKTQKLWKADLYGPMLFVNANTRAMWANTPDSARILKPANGIYKGILPANVIIANTAITWEGKLWSVILWPLPVSHDDRLSLLLHESYHRIQERIGLPSNSGVDEHLSTMDGRIYFLLETQALKAALNKPIAQRKADLVNALIFREKRHSLFPKTFYNERLLEMNEGLAEFTGVFSGRQRDSLKNYIFKEIDQAATRGSLIRSAAYITGPAYGYLLSQKAPGWTAALDSSAGFPALIAKYYQIDLPQVPDDVTLAGIAEKYNGEAIMRSEEQKEQEHQQMIAKYIGLFTRQPVLTIKLYKMNIGFNPNNLFDLGENGTVYPNAEIQDTWGKLVVEHGGLLLKDWKYASVPLTGDVLLNQPLIKGDGWVLTLNKGWKIVKIDDLHYNLTRGN